MKQAELNSILKKARGICLDSGTKLTEKRQNVLEILLKSEVPLSAYEVVDSLNQQPEQSMPPMSVYRILDFLVSQELAHKLSSTSKYLACSHITCNHNHNVPQFLICNVCQKVKEIGISKNIVDELDRSVKKAGYVLSRSQLELECLCESCFEQHQQQE